MSGWAKECEAALRAVLVEFPADFAGFFDDLEYVWDTETVDGLRWGLYERNDITGLRGRITVFKYVFDTMPDPENRAVQLRDVIRHELEHALGEIQPGHFGETAAPPDRYLEWIGQGPFKVERDGLRVVLP